MAYNPNFPYRLLGHVIVCLSSLGATDAELEMLLALGKDATIQHIATIEAACLERAKEQR